MILPNHQEPIKFECQVNFCDFKSILIYLYQQIWTPKYAHDDPGCIHLFSFQF